MWVGLRGRYRLCFACKCLLIFTADCSIWFSSSPPHHRRGLAVTLVLPLCGSFSLTHSRSAFPFLSPTSILLKHSISFFGRFKGNLAGPRCVARRKHGLIKVSRFSKRSAKNMYLERSSGVTGSRRPGKLTHSLCSQRP